MIITGMIVLLLVTGYLNFRFNSNNTNVANNNNNNQEETTTGNFFVDFRAERLKNRQEEIAYLDSIISNENSNVDAIKEAQNLKLSITRAMELENTIEGLLKAKGFSDAVVTFQTGSVNVVVKNSELTQAQVAQVLDIVKDETGEKAQNIKVIPTA